MLRSLCLCGCIGAAVQVDTQFGISERSGEPKGLARLHEAFLLRYLNILLQVL